MSRLVRTSSERCLLCLSTLRSTFVFVFFDLLFALIMNLVRPGFQRITHLVFTAPVLDCLSAIAHFCSGAHTLSRIALLICFGFLYALTKLSYIQISSPIFDSIPAVDVCTPLLVFDFDTLSFFKIADSDVYNHLTFVGIHFL